ncbi:MAG: TldD/PmbA family protein, partial [Rhodospirillales bacterium]|nr:TldD/PmbA family protein [Rhodospirillales bacterium]
MDDTKAREEAGIALLDTLIAKAKAAGADDADGVMFDSTSLEASYRMGKVEDVQRSESQDVGLRVIIGRKQAMVSTTDVRPDALDEVVERCVAMARVAPEDPYCGLADKTLLAAAFDDLELYDDIKPDVAALTERAANAEDAARGVKGVTNSEGGGAGWGRGTVALATSDGFRGAYSSSSHSVMVSVIAGKGTAMERDYDHHTAHHVSDLDSAEKIGRSAGERAVNRLNPRKMASCEVPVVFDPRIAGGMVNHLLGAITGPAIARGTSFLKSKLGQQVFAQGIEIIDDPHALRGLRSKPFDGEGVANPSTVIVKDGVLMTWLLDSASARQLGLKSTGHASRSTGGPPSPGATNCYMAAGTVSRDDLIGGIKNGFYATELIGMGVNGITGDYSRGAAGFWIENGEISFPVSELTIAGNLNDMFASLTPADDLTFRY